MAKTNGPAKIKQYSLAFKLKAVQLSHQPGVLIKDVADSLCIHSFMLSKWRKQVRGGELGGDPPPLAPQEAAELQRLRDVEKHFKRLQTEHDLLEKAIRFSSERKMKSSASSRRAGKPSRSHLEQLHPLLQRSTAAFMLQYLPPMVYEDCMQGASSVN